MTTSTPLELAVKQLQKHGYTATESKAHTGWIDVADPYVIRDGGGAVRTGSNVVTIHGTHIWKFLNDRS